MLKLGSGSIIKEIQNWLNFRQKEIGVFRKMRNGLFYVDPCWNLLFIDTCKFLFLHPIYRLKIGIKAFCGVNRFYGLYIIIVVG